MHHNEIAAWPEYLNIWRAGERNQLKTTKCKITWNWFPKAIKNRRACKWIQQRPWWVKQDKSSTSNSSTNSSVSGYPNLLTTAMVTMSAGTEKVGGETVDAANCVFVVVVFFFFLWEKYLTKGSTFNQLKHTNYPWRHQYAASPQDLTETYWFWLIVGGINGVLFQLR